MLFLQRSDGAVYNEVPEGFVSVVTVANFARMHPLLRPLSTTALVAGSSSARFPIANPVAATLDSCSLLFRSPLTASSYIAPRYARISLSVTLEPSVFSSAMLRLRETRNCI